MPIQELDDHAVRLQPTIRTLEEDCNALDQQIEQLANHLKKLRAQRKLNRDFLSGLTGEKRRARKRKGRKPTKPHLQVMVGGGDVEDGGEGAS